jgi:hypothetical protein
MLDGMESTKCWCGNERRPGGTECYPCHAYYMREWRRVHDPTPEQRRKINARRIASHYQERGKLIKQPCAVCGDPNSQKHHPDYSKPLEVIWLCPDHHHELHRKLKWNLPFVIAGIPVVAVAVTASNVTVKP